MGNRIDAMNAAMNIRNLYLQQKPQATREQVMSEVRGQLLNMKRSGVKISDKQINAAAVRVSGIADIATEQVAANFNSNVTKPAKQSVEKLNSNFLEEKHPELIEKEVPKISNNENKKQANAEYISSKKKKVVKERNEQISKEEHARSRNTKPVRNAQYSTSQGIMTGNAKRSFETVSNALDGRMSVKVSDKPNNTLKSMAAYYKKLEAQAKKAVSDVVETVVETINIKPQQTPKGKGKIGLIVAGGAAVLGTVGSLTLKKSDKSKKEQQEQINLAS